jgi:hypothetical protein
MSQISVEKQKPLASKDDLYEFVSLAHLKAWKEKKTSRPNDQMQFVGREKIEDQFRHICAQSHRKAVEIFQEMCGCKNGNCAALSDASFQAMLATCEQILLPNKIRQARKVFDFYFMHAKTTNKLKEETSLLLKLLGNIIILVAVETFFKLAFKL